MKYSVKKNPAADLLSWEVSNRMGLVVWRSANQPDAFVIAERFAFRRAFAETLRYDALTGLRGHATLTP